MTDSKTGFRLCLRCRQLLPTAEFRLSPQGFIPRICQACNTGAQKEQTPWTQIRVELGLDVPEGMKFCAGCQQTLPVESFPLRHMKSGNIGRKSRCRFCATKAQQRIRATRRYGLSCPKYGITPEQYVEMLDAQNGLCAICGKPETKIDSRTGNVYRLAIDHDHDTGRVRALLCQACNVGIGMFYNDPELMALAIRYLLDHHAR